MEAFFIRKKEIVLSFTKVGEPTRVAYSWELGMVIILRMVNIQRMITIHKTFIIFRTDTIPRSIANPRIVTIP